MLRVPMCPDLCSYHSHITKLLRTTLSNTLTQRIIYLAYSGILRVPDLYFLSVFFFFLYLRICEDPLYWSPLSFGEHLSDRHWRSTGKFLYSESRIRHCSFKFLERVFLRTVAVQCFSIIVNGIITFTIVLLVFRDVLCVSVGAKSNFVSSVIKRVV